MASGKNKQAPKKAFKPVRKSVVSQKGTPWGTIIAVVAVVALLASVLVYYYVNSADTRAQKAREEAATTAFAPKADNPDPSTKIPGVVTKEYGGSVHILANERMAYDQSPPFGGPHDESWAACNGIVYPKAVRNENMVHALEHGTVWIAYNPEQITGEALHKLEIRVNGRPYTMLSPYPGLDKPISMQSWGHQLKLDSADDERIDQFIVALRQNPYKMYPEIGASCDVMGPGYFDLDNPPAFDPSKPGPDAKPMDYQGSAGAQPDAAGNNVPQSPANVPVNPSTSTTKSGQ